MELRDNSFIAEMALEYMEDGLEDRKRIFKNQLKKLRDEELRSAVISIDINDWKYDLLKNELKRRVLLKR
ncbi:hypothetical protein ACQPU1_17005 [Clostridium paraputrificum]|uniref:hypothetical protein n=1 Tax=Clostridium TaxID=1485 RepID=UPI003D32489C